VRSGVLAALLACCSVASTATAQYRFDSFTTSSGLPQNTVSAVLQSRDGYLWIATYDGLVRYDGVRFTTFDKGNTPAIHSTQFLCLFEDAAGTIWAGTTDAGVLRFRGGAFTALDERDGLVRNYVERVQESPRGVLLFHSQTQVTLIAPDGRASAADDVAQSVFVGASTASWTREAGRITRTLNGATASYDVNVPLEDFARLRHEARDGSLWIGATRGAIVHHLAGGVVTRFALTQGPEAQPAVRIGGEDLAGRIWIQSAAGAFWIDHGALHPLDLGPQAGQIRALLCDRENTLWIGTNNRGLVHAVPDVLHAYTTDDGLPSASVYPLAEDLDGSILAGSAAFVARWSNGRATSIALPRAARSLFVDADGTVWIGTAPGLMTMKDGRLTDRSALVPGTGIDAMLRDRGGALWAGGSNGLFRIDGGTAHGYGVGDGLPAAGVNALLVDHQGRLWVGTPRGIARLDGDRFVAYGTAQGLAGDRVRALYEDAAGTIWIGTFDSGLSRFKDGRFTTYTTQTGLFSNGVFAIVEDAQGWLWMSSNRGIFRVPRSQLDDVAEGRRALVSAVAYGARDGMRSVECNGGRQSAGLRARDGRLWFPTQDGLVAIDPSRAP
jgi:ligand-binding sensor domain-containing protein